MNRLQLQELEGTVDRALDAATALLSAVADLEHAAAGLASNSMLARHVSHLRLFSDCASGHIVAVGAMARLLKCDVWPCDRVDGLCPKCERPPL